MVNASSYIYVSQAQHLNLVGGGGDEGPNFLKSGWKDKKGQIFIFFLLGWG